jgi:hypothetical protein
MKGFKINRQFFPFFIGILVSFHCFSQDDSSGSTNQLPVNVMMPEPAPMEEIFYKGSVEAGGGAIIPITDKALRISLGGVYDTHCSGEYVLAPHLFAGLELEDVQLGNTAQDAPYNTIMTIYNAGIKFGYYTYMQSDFFVCYSLSAGPSVIVYSDALIAAPRQISFFIRPNMLACYRINDELRVGIDISVMLIGSKFDPAYSGIAQYIIYNPSKDINTMTSCVGLGFCFYWAFHEAKK